MESTAPEIINYIESEDSNSLFKEFLIPPQQHSKVIPNSNNASAQDGSSSQSSLITNTLDSNKPSRSVSVNMKTTNKRGREKSKCQKQVNVIELSGVDNDCISDPSQTQSISDSLMFQLSPNSVVSSSTSAISSSLFGTASSMNNDLSRCTTMASQDSLASEKGNNKIDIQEIEPDEVAEEKQGANRMDRSHLRRSAKVASETLREASSDDDFVSSKKRVHSIFLKKEKKKSTTDSQPANEVIEITASADKVSTASDSKKRGKDNKDSGNSSSVSSKVRDFFLTKV